MANLSEQSHVNQTTNSEALDYINTLKETFQDEMDKYYNFMEIMKDLRARRIKAVDVIAKLKELFEGHPNLILGLNIFLPKDYKITLPSEDEQAAGLANPSAKPREAMKIERQRVALDDAIAYLKIVKKALRNEKEKYHGILKAFEEFKALRIDAADLAACVKELLEEHPNLILGFDAFLPDDDCMIEYDCTELDKLAVAFSML